MHSTNIYYKKQRHNWILPIASEWSVRRDLSSNVSKINNSAPQFVGKSIFCHGNMISGFLPTVAPFTDMD